MKKEYYVFDIKAVKLLDDETLLWMLISFEKLKEEIIKQALKRKLIRPRQLHISAKVERSNFGRGTIKDKMIF